MIKKFTFGLIAIALTAAVYAADLSTPQGRVEDSIGQIIALLKDDNIAADSKWLRIEDVIDSSFDFQSMSQSVLATNWKKATLGEREQFIDYFTQHLLGTYRGLIESYTDEQIRYDEESINRDRAVVETTIVTKTTEIPVNYKLKNNDGTWYAYDVEIEGASLVNNFRNEYGVIVKNDGMDGLLAHIQSGLPTTTASAE
jgi:phospholipid transport system substrate-binding protein